MWGVGCYRAAPQGDRAKVGEKKQPGPTGPKAERQKEKKPQVGPARGSQVSKLPPTEFRWRSKNEGRRIFLGLQSRPCLSTDNLPPSLNFLNILREVFCQGPLPIFDDGYWWHQSWSVLVWKQFAGYFWLFWRLLGLLWKKSVSSFWSSLAGQFTSEWRWQSDMNWDSSLCSAGASFEAWELLVQGNRQGCLCWPGEFPFESAVNPYHFSQGQIDLMTNL